MIKILSIGNSFSDDATAYLHDLAKHGGIGIKTVNLYIGGCALERHWGNVKNDAAEYGYRLNGRDTDRNISIKEALLEEKWDFITLQQASYASGVPESYFPFLTDLSDYVKSLAPQAKQLIHQTWAYETDSPHPSFAVYQNDQMTMYKALKNAYQIAAQKLDAPIIPCGDVIQALRQHPEFDYADGGLSLCRDGFHMNIPYGRYALAATWYQSILKANILKNDFVPSNDTEPVDLSLIKLIQETVYDVCNS